MIYSGISQTYMFGVFPSLKSIPTKQVGYIMAVFGAADVLGSFVAGWASDKLGRMPVVFAAALSMTIGSTIFLLQAPLGILPSPEHALYIEYIIAVLLGIADSGFNTQLYAILGAVFSDRAEAAIGAFKFFQAGSTAVLFFVGPYFTDDDVSQIFYYAVTNGFLWTGTLTFFILTLQVNSTRKYTTVNSEEPSVSEVGSTKIFQMNINAATEKTSVVS